MVMTTASPTKAAKNMMYVQNSADVFWSVQLPLEYWITNCVQLHLFMIDSPGNYTHINMDARMQMYNLSGISPPLIHAMNVWMLQFV